MSKNLPKGITKRGGKYRVSVMVDGKRRTGTRESLVEAVELAEELRTTGNLEGPENYTPWGLEEACDRYMSEVVLIKGIGPGTVVSYESRMRMLGKHLGRNTLLDDMTTPVMYRHFSDQQTKRHIKISTLKNDATLLGAIFRHARRMDGMRADVPEMPDIRTPPVRIRYLTYEEETALLDYLDHIGDEWTRDLVTVLIDTGMRIKAELLSLKPEAYDLKTRQITITETKGAGPPRAVPMTARVHEVLKRRLLAARPGKGPFGHCSYTNARIHWNRARKYLGRGEDEGFTLHICRHTFCTRLASGGVDLKTVQVLAGHRNINTTMRYAHFVPKNMFLALDALARPEEKAPSHLRVIED